MNPTINKKILLVDDTPEIDKIVALYLHNYDVVYFKNPIEALQWLHDGNFPDIIVTDLRMPEMSGEEFLQTLKSNDSWKNIPTLILSSVDNDEIRDKVKREGAIDFIQKPFNPEDLRSYIRRLIQNS
jgi:CheY-like chemotaxis protein